MRKYTLAIGDQEYTAEVKDITADYAQIVVNEKEYKVRLKDFGRKEGEVVVSRPAAASPVPSASAPAAASVPKPSAAVGSEADAVKAPLPGEVLDILVKENDSVKAGQDLLIMEAMKMENQVQAPHDGTVKKIFVRKGDSIAEGDVLLELTRPLMSTI